MVVLSCGSKMNRRFLKIANAVYRDEGFVGDFWGSKGAGMLFTTGEKILLLKRSSQVEQPGTWGVPGGAVKVDDDGGHMPLLDAAKEEVREELGRLPAFRVIGKTVFRKGGFEFVTFVALVQVEFKPTLNWENDKSGWFAVDELPNRLHFGVKYTLSQAEQEWF